MYVCVYIYIYIYIHIHIHIYTHVCIYVELPENSVSYIVRHCVRKNACGTQGQPLVLSSAPCLTQVFFKSGEYYSRFW